MFFSGFEKVAFVNMNTISRVGKSALKYAKNPTVQRNALIGAGAGAAAGAANNEDNRLGGALKGALIGGAGAGMATAGHKAFKAQKRLGGIRNARATREFYAGHGQGD